MNVNSESVNKNSLRKEIFITLFTLSIPTIMEEILSTLLQYVDTAMVGHLGETATASVSVTTTITWLVHSIPSAIGVAVLAMISQAIGRRDEKEIKKIAGQTAWLVLIFGIVLTAVCLGLSPFIPIWMGADVSIQKQASLYFFIISIPLLFRVANSVFANAIRATKDTKRPMVINMIANLMNVALNYILIYPCKLGVTGAAIASAISYSFAGIAMFVLFYKNQYLRFEKEDLRPNRKILEKCREIAIPVMCTNVVACFGYVVFASLVTGMGNTVFAAHSIAVTAETIFYIPGYGLRTATSTLVGISLGEKNREKFEMTAKISIFMTICMMCISGVVLYLVSDWLMSLFTISMAVVEKGAAMLRLVAFSEPFFGLLIVMEGIFYGLGRTRYAFVVETVGKWCVRIFFTYLCVNVWGYGLTAVWLCMIADNVTKAVMFVIPMLSSNQRKKLMNIEQ